ncbi:MAG: 2-oxo acid dehydrogenase subunit E2, partial [Sedimentisphaerales bacterium]|nr:2-oxo acid dehydrogenase subunit E2 [Sedimentisphaerales bacterium]
ETDKATMNVEATDAGRLARIIVQAGQTVNVKSPVAYLAENDADVDAYLAGSSSEEKPAQAIAENSTMQARVSSPQPSQTTMVDGDMRIRVSPAARRLAQKRNIDLSGIGRGSGPGGRIVTADIEAYVPAETGELQPVLLSRMRKAIAQNLLYSKQNIPHFYAKCTVNAEAFFNLYRQVKEQFRCTVNDFIVLSCARALKRFPAFLQQYRDNQLVAFSDVNIGIAVGTDEGLTVPVLMHADKLSLKELSEASRGLVENARNGRLENVGQGIFTITNLGMFGVEEFSAIINPPESAILAVGSIRDYFKVVNGSIVVSKAMTLVLSADHRVIDGVVAAQFLQAVKESLENPFSLVEVR